MGREGGIGIAYAGNVTVLHGTPQAGWRALELLGEQARAAVGDEIVSADGARRVRVDRGDVTAALAAAVGSADGVVVHGESGVGKSAAALGLLTTKRGAGAEDERDAAHDPVDAACAHESAGESQVVCMNLRHLPRTALEFEGTLGVPLRDLLAEMSAPGPGAGRGRRGRRC